MPFGAEVLGDGRVHFGLWAPSASRVDLGLEDESSGQLLAMAAAGNGWFETATERAGPGTLYRYRIEGDQRVPDPASRFQPQGVHGPSQVVDSRSYRWHDSEWRGRPWEDAVVYELHVGTFAPGGTFGAVEQRLGYLAELGVTAIELMPVAAFAGTRNWGYDGVLPFAPAATYGSPDEFRHLVETAHELGLMVILDVVYNHFGPEGNYLHGYAKEFFTGRHHTPWGEAINFDGDNSRTVRQFFIENALYWLEEFHLDGLRLDAVHAIIDESKPHILEELADAVRAGPGRSRHVHLILENNRNAAHYLFRGPHGRPRRYTAQWNDDFHHAWHVLLTGERDGYYVDFADDARAHLLRSLCEGFAYQGEPSAYWGGAPRGESSRSLPPSAFIAFLQNHDQVGNRAFGERLTTLAEERALKAAVSIMLLAPSIPGLFMGEEFGCSQPFLFFAGFEGPLAEAVREGRRREFSGFGQFNDAGRSVPVPDPVAAETFARSALNWSVLDEAPHRSWLRLYRALIRVRREHLVPRLAGTRSIRGAAFGRAGIRCDWRLGDGSRLALIANLGPVSMPIPAALRPSGPILHAEPATFSSAIGAGELESWAVGWYLGEPRAEG
jgi:maltooligosyltrehalose trehalohydrolase